MTNQEQIKEPKDDWRLQKIELEFQAYGEDKGKYVGKIKFQNGQFESFDFKIRPEMAQPYIDLMSADIVKCAESLGSRLIESLGLKK
jgi:hypothetical protein